MPDFETIIERSSILFTVIDEHRRITYQNNAIEGICGHTSEQVVGNDLFKYIHSEDHQRIGGVLTEPPSVETPVDYRFRHADGSWVDLELTDGPRPEPETGEYVITSQLIAERGKLQRRLDRYEALLDSLDDAVYAIEPDGTIVYVNDAYASMKGIDREELLGTDIYEWGSDSAVKRIQTVREEILDGEIGVVEFEFSTIDGKTIPVELRFNTVTQPGNDLERVGVIRDVTERKARERALEQQNERLEEFASIVSHDLRNPLSVAKGWLELAQTDCDSDALKKVETAHSRMNTLIEDLLTLAREGKSIEETEVINLRRAIERGWQSVDTGQANLRIDTDQTIHADGPRLQQLLENLIRNAIEHGGTDVTVSIGELDDGFFIADDGPGIPENEREQVFETGYSTAQSGTGFGLGIVKRIVDGHGWEIDLTDSFEGGARFEIRNVKRDAGEV